MKEVRAVPDALEDGPVMDYTSLNSDASETDTCAETTLVIPV